MRYWGCDCLNQWSQDPNFPVLYHSDTDSYSLVLSPELSIPNIYCMMDGDLDISNEERAIECQCGQLALFAADPKLPIEFDVGLNEYHLIRPDGGGYYRIYFCPVCGHKLPPSRRSEHFVVPSAEEVEELSNRLNAVTTLDGVIKILGKPDRDFIPPPHDPLEKQIYGYRDVRRVVSYKSVARTIDIYVREDEDGHIRISFPPKEKV